MCIQPVRCFGRVHGDAHFSLQFQREQRQRFTTPNECIPYSLHTTSRERLSGSDCERHSVVSLVSCVLYPDSKRVAHAQIISLELPPD